MSDTARPQAVPYTPQYFLAALGAGGLAVSFFMYLLWMTPHTGAPIPHFASLSADFAQAGLALQALMIVAIAGIAFFAVWHVRLLIWNLGRYAAWARTPAFARFREGNMESQLMALPLALAMSVNVAFVTGAVFVPGLWGIREALFPLALAAFAGIGILAFRIYLAFISRVLVEGGYECAKSNNLGQMIAVFAFAMIGVGFSASAAMSAVPATAAIGFVGASFFLAAAIVLGAIKLVLGFRAMMEFRAGAETTPTLWIVIPFLTVIGIGIYRLKMSLAHQFGVPVSDGEIFALLSAFLGIQLLFGLIGWAVMRRVGYFGRWVNGPEKSPGAFALVCPGVALFVFGNFMINPGLVGIGVVAPFSLAYGALYLPLVAVQLATIWLFVKLTRKLIADNVGAADRAALQGDGLPTGQAA
ncbi:MAG: TsoY family (seleno)protein [Salinarimonas sp.]